ncbi:hypothetical protein DL98DRAFT_657230 [Cadophora sp. DSE1049]|nr:hypothetical protein DL98DRAFT_657230 [Cadophora sp. DSE1049]
MARTVTRTGHPPGTLKLARSTVRLTQYSPRSRTQSPTSASKKAVSGLLQTYAYRFRDANTKKPKVLRAHVKEDEVELLWRSNLIPTEATRYHEAIKLSILDYLPTIMKSNFCLAKPFEGKGPLKGHMSGFLKQEWKQEPLDDSDHEETGLDVTRVFAQLPEFSYSTSKVTGGLDGQEKMVEKSCLQLSFAVTVGSEDFRVNVKEHSMGVLADRGMLKDLEMTGDLRGLVERALERADVIWAGMEDEE